MKAGLQVFFDLLYHQFAWTYDWVARIVSVGLWEKWVISVLPLLTGPSILELGFGPGHLQEILCAQGYSAHGLDESKWMARLCQKNLIDRDFFPKLVNGKAQAVPFKDNAFDCVVATFPSDYFIQRTTLDEVHRILKPGGKFVVLPVAQIRGDTFIYRLAFTLFKITGETPEWNIAQLRKQFVSPISRAGFTVELHQQEVGSSQVLIIVATNSPKVL